MSDSNKIKTAFERNAEALALRPGIGQGTAVTRARVIEGMTCEIEDGPWKLRVDMAEKHGGENKGPNPGVYGRAALGSCLAIGYVRWAAKLGVPLSGVEVEVQADYDARGEYAIVEMPADYSEIRYIVSIESPAPEEQVLKVIEQADAHSSFYDIFNRPQKLVRQVRIKGKII